MICYWDHSSKPSAFVVIQDGNEIHRGCFNTGYDLYQKHQQKKKRKMEIQQNVDLQKSIQFMVGDEVSKVGGDYSFDGIVRSVFTKGSGVIRLVVEDDRGILHIYSEKNLKHK
jgi:hypothetical protein